MGLKPAKNGKNYIWNALWHLEVSEWVVQKPHSELLNDMILISNSYFIPTTKLSFNIFHHDCCPNRFHKAPFNIHWATLKGKKCVIRLYGSHSKEHFKCENKTGQTKDKKLICNFSAFMTQMKRNVEHKMIAQNSLNVFLK